MTPVEAVARKRFHLIKYFCRNGVAHSTRLGAIESVLVERGGIGRQEQFIPVAVPGHPAGEIVSMRITGSNQTGLVGEPMRTAA